MTTQKTKEQIMARMNKIGHTTRLCNGACPIARAKSVGEIDKEKRVVPFVLISKDNAGERYDWWEDTTYIEELDVKGANFEPLKTFFKDHMLCIDNAIGRVDNTRIEEDELKAEVAFGSDEEALKIFQRYADGILSDVSIGYVVKDIVVTERKDEPTHVLVTEYDIVELSAVWKGFDAGAGRSKTKPKARDKPKKNGKKRDKKIKKELKKARAKIQILQKKLNLKGK